MPERRKKSPKVRPANVERKTHAPSVILPIAILIFALLLSPLFYGSIRGSSIADATAWLVLPPVAVFFAAHYLRILHSEILAILALWLLFVVVQLPISEYGFLSSIEILSMSCWLAVFIIAYLAVALGASSFLVRLISLAGVLPSLWGMFLHIGREPGNPFYAGLTGTFGLHNPFAGFLLMTIPLTAYCLWSDRMKRFVRMLWAVSLLIQVTAFILTRSRAAWLVALIIILLFSLTPVFKSRFGKLIKIGIGALVVLGIAAFIFALIPPDWLFEKYRARFELLDYSIKGRYEFWRAALLMFLDNPVFGTGAGTFQNAYTRYQQSIVFFATDPHSFPLHIAAGQGVLGLAFLFSAIAVTWRNFSRWIAIDKTGKARAVSFAVIAVFLHSAVDFDLTLAPNAMALFSLIAMAAFFGNSSPELPEQTDTVTAIFRKWSITAAVISLTLAWSVTTLFARTPWVYKEARIKGDIPPSKHVYGAPMPSATIFERTYESIAMGNGVHGKSEMDPNLLFHDLRKFSERNPKIASVWFLRAIISFREFGNANAAAEFSKKAIELDPYNFPDYYAFLASVLESAGRSEEAYFVLRECLLEKIPIVEPVYPEHVKPTWQAKNMLFAVMWRELGEYESEFGDHLLSEEYLARARSFIEYVEQHGG